MATTINHSYDDTFNVYDFVTGVRIGQIALMSDGWAAYRAVRNGDGIQDRRIDTFDNAEKAINALDEYNNHKSR